jgi:hypothetical protein
VAQCHGDDFAPESLKRNGETSDANKAVVADPSLSGSSDWVRYRLGAMSGVTLMRAHFTEPAFERHSHPEYGIGLTYSGIQTFHCRGSLRMRRGSYSRRWTPSTRHKRRCVPRR